MKTSMETIISIIAHRAAGNGVRVTARLCGVHRDTVVGYSLLVGEGCARLLERMMHDLHIHRLELDELHTYIHTRQRHLRADAPPDRGDVWAYLAEDVVSRAIVSYVVDKRTQASTQKFVDDIRRRIVGRLHITSDGHAGYLTAIARAFGGEVDYAQLVKAYTGGRSDNGLAVADKYVSSSRTAIFGCPDIDDSSTSYVERLNGTVRARLSKFSRRRNNKAKSLQHLRADFAMFVAVYNLVDVHSTTKRTPAHALGIAERPWSLAELVEAALAEPVPVVAAAVTPPAPTAITETLVAIEHTALATEPRRREITLRQMQVLKALRSAAQLTLAEMAAAAFPTLEPAQANSWVRNQLRGLLAAGLVEHIGKGTYRALLASNATETAKLTEEGSALDNDESDAA